MNIMCLKELAGLFAGGKLARASVGGWEGSPEARRAWSLPVMGLGWTSSWEAG